MESCVDVSLCTGNVAVLKLILRSGTRFIAARILPGVATMIGTLPRMTVATLKIARESANTFEIFSRLS